MDYPTAWILPPCGVYNVARYEYHHRRWSKAKAEGDWAKAKRHLYALRAHLKALGWLAAEYDKPGLGVR